MLFGDLVLLARLPFMILNSTVKAVVFVTLLTLEVSLILIVEERVVAISCWAPRDIFLLIYC